MVKVSTPTTPRRVVMMSEMLPMQVGIVIHGYANEGHVVMRSQNVMTGEIMDLTEPRTGCWDYDSRILVALFNPDEEITITITNNEEE